MLIRWRVLQTPWFGFYVHFIHREDLDRMPHDHPWNFWTLVVRGSYWENYHSDSRTLGIYHAGSNWSERGHDQIRGRWSFRKFPMQAAHRIIKTNGKVTTLVIVGPKRRTWGFYTQEGTFIDWRDYHGITGKKVW
jgi:hypothetical protein